MKKSILFVIICCALSVGFVGWRVLVSRNQMTPHFEIVVDPSLSHPQSCESLLGLVEQTLHAESVTKDSTLTVLVLGDKATANEPWQLGRHYIPASRKVLEGKTANLRRQEELLSDILTKCKSIRHTSISPIFMGVKQAVADLRAHGCRENSDCKVFVDTDLEENVEISIEEALNQSHNTKLMLPDRLDNQGLEVTFCGVAVSAPRIFNPSGVETRRTLPRDPNREDRLRRVWQALFTHPELVKFAPYCLTLGDHGLRH